MDSQAGEILSAFIDGEQVDAVDLASALAKPGAREALIDFVRLRAAFADDSRPSERFSQEMRSMLDGRRRRLLSRPLRLVAAAAVFVLATLGALDLGRRLRPQRAPDDPPAVARVIRYEPGVDWKPLQRR